VSERGSTGDVTPKTFLSATAGSIVVVAAVGVLVAWIRGRSVNESIAVAYYFVGSVVFLVGSFPTGGYSLRGRRTTRRPTGSGSFAAPSMILGLLLIGVGVLVDVLHPF
jgi:hypothetical protein